MKTKEQWAEEYVVTGNERDAYLAGFAKRGELDAKAALEQAEYAFDKDNTPVDYAKIWNNCARFILGDIKKLDGGEIEDGSPGKGIGQHIALFELDGAK